MSDGGWQRLHHKTWAKARGHLTAPWPQSFIDIDIGYLLDLEKHYGQRPPSILKLAKLWGINRGKVYRLLKAARESSDEGVMKVCCQRDEGVMTGLDRTPKMEEKSDEGVMKVCRQSDEGVMKSTPSISTRARKDTRHKTQDTRQYILPKALNRAGVYDLAQLSEMTRQQAAAIRGIGPAALERLDKALEASGLAWTRPRLELVPEAPKKPNAYRLWVDVYREVMGRDYVTTSAGRDASSAKTLLGVMGDDYGPVVRRFLQDHRDGRPCWPTDRPATLSKMLIGDTWRKYVERVSREQRQQRRRDEGASEDMRKAQEEADLLTRCALRKLPPHILVGLRQIRRLSKHESSRIMHAIMSGETNTLTTEDWAHLEQGRRDRLRAIRDDFKINKQKG